MNFSFITPILIAFGVNVFLSPIVIPFLSRLKFGQYIRDDGPSSHLKKAGTPTMGGIIILTSILITSLFYVRSYPKIIPVLFVTLGFGIIGFLDDFIKVVMKRSLGLRAWQKVIGQILVTSIFGYYLLNYTDVDTSMIIPFANGQVLSLGIWFLPVLFFVMIGTVNSVNLTDGLDGLAASITVLVAAFFSVVSIGVNSGIEPITCAAVGSLLGFLLFNSHPARVFMGDTGSLALGGFVAATAYMLQMPLFLLIVGLIYVLETTSVMLQVLYFKKTKKRIFKMAPIHHHFELSGWRETKIVSVFGIITAILCLIGLLAL
ncbi:phospho-N-acetylmuramoyl-pentapeptide-transferase [Natranaerovirga pectinivora]|uniref:Phospho-N-acetylmuramoyl-pentapeptide-transferase n=1 Tax=Natranaerovirga pectinivora TaxID=682400 RepID=A0A4R3MNL1_9FIRM|nr:phospho-N-acetylmuramoyl-pentapeptide-transferase [Natranaerovirga pectinivora]TCT16855.1 phospho-N-acetylmuramoyl-pentapeptide-transferase [Natranaerovirga pectinivora]